MALIIIAFAITILFALIDLFVMLDTDFRESIFWKPIFRVVSLPFRLLAKVVIFFHAEYRKKFPKLDKAQLAFKKSSDPRDILCYMVAQHLLRVDSKVGITEYNKFSKNGWNRTYKSETKNIWVDQHPDSITMTIEGDKYPLNKIQEAYMTTVLELVKGLCAERKLQEKETKEKLRALDTIEKLFKE